MNIQFGSLADLLPLITASEFCGFSPFTQDHLGNHKKFAQDGISNAEFDGCDYEAGTESYAKMDRRIIHHRTVDYTCDQWSMQSVQRTSPAHIRGLYMFKLN